ncbi:MAG TPA: phosphatase PAP2 family protein [Pyrinomonadaceae bacterium]|nr:phosphatase PAP2 family protein [Pyrinomonadaceae bacterium]
MRSNELWLYRFVVITLALACATTITKAQTPQPSPTPSASPSLERRFLKNILHDQKAIWSSPFHLEKSDARWLVPLGAGTAGLIATDGSTAKWVAQFDDQLDASRIVSYAGSTYGAAGVGAVFYFAGRASHNPRARETGLLSWEALLNSELVVLPLKAIAGRKRPLETHRGDFFRGGTSFPSGHAIHAWSVATVIANEYSDHRIVQVTAYGVAAAVSLARLTGEKHFVSDIFVGSAMGYGIGHYVYHAHHRAESNAGGGEEEESRADHRWPAIAPVYDRHAHDYGVALAWSF